MSSVFKNIDCEVNHCLKFWRKPDEFSLDDYSGNILHCSFLNLLNPDKTFDTWFVSVSSTCLYYSKDKKNPHRMAIITWKQLEAFVEFNDHQRRYGFKLTQNDSFQDFFSESKEEIDKWLDALSPIVILTDFNDSFSIVKEVGAGSFSTVYLAKDLYDDQNYAVKSIDKGLITNERSLELLISEISIMRKLDNKSLVKLHKVYESETHVHLILDYAEGGDLLGRILKISNFSEVDAIKFIKNLLTALCYMHNKLVIHRDLKLENILLISEISNIEFKIADFGFACNIQPNLALPCGSPGYMAPEMLKNTSYDEKVDVFSSGVILYILLSGRCPFSGKTQKDILLKNRECRITFNEKFWKNVSKPGVQFVLWLTESDPHSRPTAEEALRHPWLQNGSEEKLGMRFLGVPRMSDFGISGELLKRSVLADKGVKKDKNQETEKIVNLSDAVKEKSKFILSKLRQEDCL